MDLFRHSRSFLIALLLSASLILGGTEAFCALSHARAVSDEKEQSQGGGAAVTDQASGIGYATELYDASNGLPTSDANTVLSTSDGFIWIGGYSGLIRFDGTSFERQDSSGGITNANALFEDSRGRMWVGTNDNGVVVTDKDFSRHYSIEDGLPTSAIHAITEDGDGNILIGTNQGLCYVDPELELHPFDDGLNDAYINRLTTDAAGDVYGITKDGDFFHISGLKVIATSNGASAGIGEAASIYADPAKKNRVYVGTFDGKIIYAGFKAKFKPKKTISISEGGINWISTASNRLWALTDENIAYIDSRDEVHFLENLPTTSAFGSMCEDYEGNLWFASSRQGVMKIVANKFTDVTAHAAVESGVVNATCLRDRSLYIGTDTGLIILNRSRRPVTNKLTKYIGDSRIRCIMEDGRGNLWISTYTNGKGLICYSHDGEITSFTTDNGMPSNETRGTAIASDGSVLEATNAGLAVIKKGRVKRVYGADSGISNTAFLTVAEGDDGKYYIGTDGGGIYIADGDKITQLGRSDGLTSDVVLRIKNDKERGVLWIITSNSLQYIKDGEIHTVDSFPYSNNYDIYFDNNGQAWILSSNGIYVADAAKLVDGGDTEYLFYNLSNGLPSLPTGNAFCGLYGDGTLYIACRSGVSSVNINNYFEQTHSIKLTIPYVEADNVRYYPDAGNVIRLPSSANVITVCGYALTYSMQNPSIEYYLSGFDRKHYIVSKEDMEPVRYTNLPGGEYTYHLSVVNTSTNDVQQTTYVRIIKERAFYEQSGFAVFCVAAVILLVIVLARIYTAAKTKALLRKEEENRMLIREMTEAFARTIDLKDKYTNGHSTRVAEYTAMLTRELGYNDETVERFYNIALLHDIGKIGIPQEVLNKPGKLTDQEFKIIKSHSALGYNVLKDISIMPELAIGAGAHHERPDGKGYPNGLKGDEIPRVAQIIAVADTFDAMYSDRPYRKRMNFEKVVSIMKEVAGTQLTTDVVDAFLSLVEKGKFRDPDDRGGGSMEDIDNIHKKFEKENE